MKVRRLIIAVAAVSLTIFALQQVAKQPANRPAITTHRVLPSESTAKTLLNTTQRHREWVNVPVGAATVRAFVVYPGRSSQAPVVVLTAKNQGASDWIRAVGIQVADEGYIAVVPDVLSGLGPNGGDTESFPGPGAVAAALDRLGQHEAVRRTKAVLAYAVSLPAANGRSASLELDPGTRIYVAVDSRLAKRVASFKLSSQAWSQALAFLADQTGNRPVFAPVDRATAGAAEDHSAHIMMAMAQAPSGAPAPGPGGPRGYPAGKLPDLPAGLFNAKSTLVHSTLRREFVDIPVGSVKLHTWIEYPAGNDKAPVVIVMQHGPGLDEWQRSLADQLALQGFLAVAADLYSGLGPNGGNWDSFEGTDAAMRAAAKLTQDEGIRRYKAAYDYAMKLPRANGKVASLGFCAGGSYSFRFAGEVPGLNAAVVFYGTQPSEEIMAKIKAPVLGFYGEDDARVTSTVEPTVAAMKRLGKAFEPHIYPHGTHGFLEYQDLGGNPAASTDSWSRTIAFLNQHIR